MDTFLGGLYCVAFNFAPVGFALCDGSLLPISQNTALFSLLGTTYGGDGINTFALPDLRGRAPIGMGQRPGQANHVIGEVAGVQATPAGQYRERLTMNWIIATQGIFPSRP
jgi:microcystin-dependent protein